MAHVDDATRFGVSARFTPDGARHIWKVSGDADFAAILGRKRSDRGFECVATPTGFEPVFEANQNTNANQRLRTIPTG